MGQSSADRMRGLAAGLAAIAVLLPASMSAAQASATTPPGDRVSLSATAGVSRPSEPLFRDIYGGAMASVTGQAAVRLAANGTELFVGVRHMRTSGEAVSGGGSAFGSPGAVEFRMSSVRLGVARSLPQGAWILGAGIGGSYNWYREEWRSFDQAASGGRAGLIAQASIARRVSRRWAVLARGEYSFVLPARASGDLDPVKLGGLDVGAGLAFRF